MTRQKAKPAASRNPAGRPKDASKRADIVRAADALFLQQGYERTSMLKVAKKAGVSKLTIYSHFADKDALFREVITEKCNKHMVAASYDDMAKLPVEDALLKIARNFTNLIFNGDSLCLHRIVQSEVSRHPHVVKLFFEAGPQRVRQHFAELMLAWKKQGKVVVPDAMKAAEHFFSLMKGELHQRIMLRITPTPSPTEIEKHIQSAVRVFLSAYKK